MLDSVSETIYLLVCPTLYPSVYSPMSVTKKLTALLPLENYLL